MTFLHYGYTVQTAPAQDITHRSQIFFSVNRPIDKQICVVYPARAIFLKVNRQFKKIINRTIISFVQPQPNSIQNKNKPIWCGTAPGNLAYHLSPLELWLKTLSLNIHPSLSKRQLLLQVHLNQVYAEKLLMDSISWNFDTF